MLEGRLEGEQGKVGTMAILNRKTKTSIKTYEGTVAKRITPEQMLRRSLMSCLLWENEFYESGKKISGRLCELVHLVEDPEIVASIMIEARQKMYLRHAPLLIAAELCKRKALKAEHLDAIIQRADELSEFLAVYWRNGKCPLAGQVKKGLARAFQRFDSYALSKYNRDVDIKLRDVLFLCHAKPKNKEQEKLWKKLIDGTLEPPDTWEVDLSGKHGKNKKESWTRLLKENKLGGLALLRNLRNIKEAGVDSDLVKQAVCEMTTDKILPFRFVTAAKYAPQWEDVLEKAMYRCVADLPKLKGHTALVIDTSPSMWMEKISAKSEMDRFEAASALAILAREICESVSVYAFNREGYVVPNRRGFALRDALAKTKGNSSYGGLGVILANKDGYDRIIVLTDGQWHDHRKKTDVLGWIASDDAIKISDAPLTHNAYMLNVASCQYGVGYGKWTSIDGFSENTLKYIYEFENDTL